MLHFSRHAVIMLLTLCLSVWAGCDLLEHKKDIIRTRPTGKPTNLARPDSVLKMLTYIFSVHDEEAADAYGDLLYDGFVYRYRPATDTETVLYYKQQEVQIYKNIFASFLDISAKFYVEEDGIWTEYGSRMDRPSDVLESHVSAQHPLENWQVYTVLGDMYFKENTTNTGDFSVRQSFLMKFRLDETAEDSTWQLASWTDLEAIYN